MTAPFVYNESHKKRRLYQKRAQTRSFTMKYKNIIFDYGNVIGKFDGRYIMEQFCSTEKDCDLLCSVIYEKWGELDKGTADYNCYAKECASRLPARLADAARNFFREWPEHISPNADTLRFIEELSQRKVPLYLLSNAPTFFVSWAAGNEVLKQFSGVVFSAPLKMAKPDSEIYRWLFRTYSLDPKECFFIDDLEKNIAAGQALGMDGIVFDGDIRKVKTAIRFDE